MFVTAPLCYDPKDVYCQLFTVIAFLKLLALVEVCGTIVKRLQGRMAPFY